MIALPPVARVSLIVLHLNKSVSRCSVRFSLRLALLFASVPVEQAKLGFAVPTKQQATPQTGTVLFLSVPSPARSVSLFADTPAGAREGGIH